MPDTSTDPRRDNARSVRCPRGPELSAKSWLTEAPLRMLMNNLDPEVAEKPEELVVYGGIGGAARDWKCLDALVPAPPALGDEETDRQGPRRTSRPQCASGSTPPACQHN